MKKMMIKMMLLFTTFSSAMAQQWNSNPVIAHRGAWKIANLPENSIASLKQAIKLKCYGSEFDVHLTKDSVVVVNHNADFLGTPIATATYKELLDKKLSNGESIPTLAAYLKAGVKQKRTKLILEIKPQNLGNERDELLTALVLKEVDALKAAPWIEYISFGYNICQYLVKNKPEAKVFYLKGEINPTQLKTDQLAGFDYHYSVLEKNPTWIADAQQLGLKTNAWTVNETKDIDRLLSQKIDFITTNEPELVFERIKAKQ